MFPLITIAAAIFYVALICTSLLFTFRRNHIAAAWMWLVAGGWGFVALVNELAGADYVSALIWVFNVALAAFNVRAERRRAARERADRERFNRITERPFDRRY